MSQDHVSSEEGVTDAQIFAAHVSNLADAFWWQIDALLEVTDAALPEIEKLDSSHKVMSSVSRLTSSLTEESREKLKAAFWKCEERQQSDGSPSFMESMWEEVKAEPWGPTFMMHLHEALQRPPRAPMFLQSTTVSAVSAFEVLLSGLASQYFTVTPQALDAASRDKEKEFSLRELKELGSIADAIDMIIERRVDELMFGSFSDWRKFFLDRMKLKFEDFAIDWEALKEVFQRRHVIVHNGGLASRRYVRNVAPRFAADIKEGAYLRVDPSYVNKAASELLAFGFLLATAMGRKLAKEYSEFFLNQLQKFTYRNLVKGRYEVVDKCSAYGESVSIDMSAQLIFRVNRWIARQRLNDAAVRAEVEDWDVRALSPRFQLAKHCLLGEVDPAMTLLRSLYSMGEIGFEDIIEWPLLEPLRGSDAYVAMTRTMEIPEGWHLSEVILHENPKTKTLHSRTCSLVQSNFRRKTIDQIDPSTALLCKRCKPSLTR
ncbi:hypothetical protein [Streptomyces sp. enrichment culture]|uniref:hypothetical protein n=1 Tax=Streptomyces sp. enrichment culture TaxID=1795815 RepID=UPI003F56FCD2